MDIKYPIAPCILLLHYLVKHKCQQKQAINDKLQVSVDMQGAVGFLKMHLTANLSRNLSVKTFCKLVKI